MFYSLSGLNVSLYVAHDKVQDKKRMHENQDSKIQQYVKKGKSHRREGHTSKYKFSNVEF